MPILVHAFPSALQDVDSTRLSTRQYMTISYKIVYRHFVYVHRVYKCAVAIMIATKARLFTNMFATFPIIIATNRPALDFIIH